jgi:hypothetical protein
MVQHGYAMLSLLGPTWTDPVRHAGPICQILARTDFLRTTGHEIAYTREEGNEPPLKMA